MPKTVPGTPTVVDPDPDTDHSGAAGLTTAAMPGVGGSTVRHASHYLTERVRSAALQTVLERTAELLRFPLGLVNIADAHSLHPVAVVGTSAGRVVDRCDTPCDEVVTSGGPVSIEDLFALRPLQAGAGVGAEASGAAQYPVLAAAGMRAYLGVPLRGREGTVVGSLCVMDTAPRVLDGAHTALLLSQAEVVEDQLDLHRRYSDLHLLPPADDDQPDSEQPGGRGDRWAPRGLRTIGVAGATADLRRGLDAGEIVVHYEPIVEVATGELHGFEALARWQHPRRGLLSPAAFIPLAEDSDLIIDLDLAVLEQAAHQLRRWQQRRPNLQVNVNMSARHLLHPECVHRIRDVVARAGVEPATVALEITESALVTLTPLATTFVQGLRTEGFRVFFDDFGTGWACLAYLLHLPSDGVKIDRTFTAALSTRTGAALVRALMNLTEDLGLDTVVEGVSSAADAAQAQQWGFHLAQGHFYSPPRAPGVIQV